MSKTTKCIIMTRVSTDLQELDIQEEECIKMAVADGYINDKEHIILIPRLGESARKIGEIETVKTRRGLVDIELDRDGIWDMKEHIRLDPEIDCVYIWEVSRLARRMEILTPLLKYFADKKIQLKIKTSGIEFLNPDKSVNSASKMTIEILGEVAEQEMDIKIKRFKRTKKVMAEQGRYAGGKIPYGYEIDREHGNIYKIKEEEATIVREIYDLYESGITQTCIAREFYRRGMIEINLSKVNNILTNEQYTGRWIRQGWSSYDRRYPIIITPEQFDKCRKIASSNNTFASKCRNIYYAHKLIVCKCGRLWGAGPSKVFYRCAEAHRTGNEFESHVLDCTHKISISINIMDSLLWHLAQQAEVEYIVDGAEKDKINYQQKINILDQKLCFIDTRLQEQDRKRKRATDTYIEGLISKTERDEKLKETEDATKAILLEQKQYLHEKSHIHALLIDIDKIFSLSDSCKIEDRLEKIAELQRRVAEISDDTERFDIIHKLIKKVEVQNRTIEYTFGIVGKKQTEARYITVYFYNDEIKYFYYLPHSGGKNVILETNEEGTCQDRVYYEYLGRFFDSTKKKKHEEERAQRLSEYEQNYPSEKYVYHYDGLMNFLGIKRKMAYKLGYQGCLESTKVKTNNHSVAFNKQKVIEILRLKSQTERWIKKIYDNIPEPNKQL